MNKFTTTRYEKLLEELDIINAGAENTLQAAERSVVAIKEAIRQLKDFILTHTFKDKAEEIRFFKEIKPQFLSTLIYHSELYETEARKPVGTNDVLKNYYYAELERLSSYFIRNQVFYNYYRADKTIYDELFFLRDNANDVFITENSVEIDNRFCTAYSYKLSKLIAYEMVGEYLRKCIYKLEYPETFAGDNKDRKFLNQWTDTKAALIELAYALQARGAVNNGKGDIKKIITDLEILFNVELGNFYRTFQNMRIRKKNTTPFLDGLKESLERKMEENY